MSTKVLMLSFEPFRRTLNAVSFISSIFTIASRAFAEQSCCWTFTCRTTSFGVESLRSVGMSSTLMARRREGYLNSNESYHPQNRLQKSMESSA